MARQQQDSRELAPITQLAPSRLPVVQKVLDDLQLTEPEWRVLTDQVYPSARSAEAISLALSYCRHRSLDIYKRPVHIVPMWSTQLKRYVETVWPGIAELRTTASRTKNYAGIDLPKYGPAVDEEFVEVFEDERDSRNNREKRFLLHYPEYCDMVVYRMVAGIRCAFNARVFWKETYATAGRFSEAPNSMWRKRPYGQIDKCAEAAALRKGFPEEIGNEYAAEEMIGKTIDHDDEEVAGHVVQQSRPSYRPPRPPEPKQGNGDAAKTAAEANEPESGGDVVDAEVEPIGDEPTGDLLTAADEEYLDELRDRLGEAPDATTVEQIWSEIDPLAHFEGDTANRQVAQSIKDFRLRTLASQKRGGR
jgi:phage recombination protein Bet